MKIKITIRMILLFTCLLILRPGNSYAQILTNTSWRPIDNLAIALKNNGIDTLTITFLSNNRMEFRYFANNTSSTSYGLWWQQGPGYFKYADTSTSGISLLCDPDDTAYVQYTIDTGVMHFANMQDSCGTRGTLFTDSKWALVDNNVNIKDAFKIAPCIRIYPNPSSGGFSLDFKDVQAGTYAIRIYNLLAQQVWSTAYSMGNDPEIHVSPLPGGIYLVKIESGFSPPVIYKVQVAN